MSDSLSVQSGGQSGAHNQQRPQGAKLAEDHFEKSVGAGQVPQSSAGDGIAKDRKKGGGSGPAAFLSLSKEAQAMLKK